MAREYGKIMSRIWRDPDFRALGQGSQWLYMMLVSQPDISSVGALPITLQRWVGYASHSHCDSPSECLSEWLSELQRKGFVVIDPGAQELLVRSFVKYDRGFTNPKRRLAIAAAAESVTSPYLRGFLVAILNSFDVKHTLADTPLEWVSDSPSDSRTDSPSDKASDSQAIVQGSRLRNVSREPTGSLKPETESQEPTTLAATASQQNGAATREPDELFDALVGACRIEPRELTVSLRGAVNRALKDLRAVEATPGQVGVRAKRFYARYPTMTLTPSALAKHWALLGAAAAQPRDDRDDSKGF